MKTSPLCPLPVGLHEILTGSPASCPVCEALTERGENPRMDGATDGGTWGHELLSDGYVEACDLHAEQVVRDAILFAQSALPVQAAACPLCGGWTGSGGMSQYAHSSVPIQGRTGCFCHGLPRAREESGYSQR